MSSTYSAEVLYPAPPSSTGKSPYVQAPLPAGFPTRDDHAASKNSVFAETKSKGGGFWKDCCAVLLCCCSLDVGLGVGLVSRLLRYPYPAHKKITRPDDQYLMNKDRL